MNTKETGLLLDLFHAPGISSALLRRLLDTPASQTQGIEHQALALCRDAAERQAVLGSLRAPAAARTEAAQRWLQQPGNRLLSAADTDYPALLKQIPDYPPLLFVKGDAGCLTRPMMAIVGSRNSTAYGRSVAYRLAADLSHMGLLICSGLAGGIDTQAHLAALDAGSNTVAVLGNGLDSIYPAANKALAARMLTRCAQVGGALVSELALDAGPLSGHFPRRNRIISGLSLGVCVVEANMRSGSLITARLALEQNREVFAVPGSVNSTVSRGCHRLLREGAVLTESAEDIAEHIGFLCQAQLAMAAPPECAPALPAHCEGVYAELCQDATSTDTLLSSTGLDFAELSEKLLQLELAGLAGHQGNRWWRLHGA